MAREMFSTRGRGRSSGIASGNGGFEGWRKQQEYDATREQSDLQGQVERNRRERERQAQSAIREHERERKEAQKQAEDAQKDRERKAKEFQAAMEAKRKEAQRVGNYHSREVFDSQNRATKVDLEGNVIPKESDQEYEARIRKETQERIAKERKDAQSLQDDREEAELALSPKPMTDTERGKLEKARKAAMDSAKSYLVDDYARKEKESAPGALSRILPGSTDETKAKQAESEGYRAKWQDVYGKADYQPDEQEWEVIRGAAQDFNPSLVDDIQKTDEQLAKDAEARKQHEDYQKRKGLRKLKQVYPAKYKEVMAEKRANMTPEEREAAYNEDLGRFKEESEAFGQEIGSYNESNQAREKQFADLDELNKVAASKGFTPGNTVSVETGDGTIKHYDAGIYSQIQELQKETASKLGERIAIDETLAQKKVELKQRADELNARQSELNAVRESKEQANRAIVAQDPLQGKYVEELNADEAVARESMKAIESRLGYDEEAMATATEAVSKRLDDRNKQRNDELQAEYDELNKRLTTGREMAAVMREGERTEKDILIASSMSTQFGAGIDPMAGVAKKAKEEGYAKARAIAEAKGLTPAEADEAINDARMEEWEGADKGEKTRVQSSGRILINPDPDILLNDEVAQKAIADSGGNAYRKKIALVELKQQQKEAAINILEGLRGANFGIVGKGAAMTPIGFGIKAIKQGTGATSFDEWEKANVKRYTNKHGAVDTVGLLKGYLADGKHVTDDVKLIVRKGLNEAARQFVATAAIAQYPIGNTDLIHETLQNVAAASQRDVETKGVALNAMGVPRPVQVVGEGAVSIAPTIAWGGAGALTKGATYFIGKQIIGKSATMMARKAAQGTLTRKVLQGTSKMLASSAKKYVERQGLGGASAGAFSQTFGSALPTHYTQYIEQGLTPDEALDKAMGTATVSAVATAGLTMGFGYRGVENVFGKTGAELLVKGGKDGLLKAIQDKGYRKLFAEVVKERLLDGASEIPEEGLDALWSGMVEKWTVNPDKTWGEIWSETFEAGAVGGVLGFGAPAVKSVGGVAEYMKGRQLRGEDLVLTADVAVARKHLEQAQPPEGADPQSYEAGRAQALALLKIREGGIDSLSQEELASLHLGRKDGKVVETPLPKGEDGATHVRPVMVEDGEIVVTDEGIAAVGEMSPEAREVFNQTEQEQRDEIRINKAQMEAAEARSKEAQREEQKQAQQVEPEQATQGQGTPDVPHGTKPDDDPRLREIVTRLVDTHKMDQATAEAEARKALPKYSPDEDFTLIAQDIADNQLDTSESQPTEGDGVTAEEEADEDDILDTIRDEERKQPSDEPLTEKEQKEEAKRVLARGSKSDDNLDPIPQPLPNGRKAATKEAQAPTKSKGNLPKELSGAKPRFGQSVLEFESDVDRALFITSQKKPSKRDADYRSFLLGQGFTESEIDAEGQKLRGRVKGLAIGKMNTPGSAVKIPYVEPPVKLTAKTPQQVKEEEGARILGEVIGKDLADTIKRAGVEVVYVDDPGEGYSGASVNSRTGKIEVNLGRFGKAFAGVTNKRKAAERVINEELHHSTTIKALLEEYGGDMGAVRKMVSDAYKDFEKTQKKHADRLGALRNKKEWESADDFKKGMEVLRMFHQMANGGFTTENVWRGGKVNAEAKKAFDALLKERPPVTNAFRKIIQAFIDFVNGNKDLSAVDEMVKLSKAADRFLKEGEQDPKEALKEKLAKTKAERGGEPTPAKKKEKSLLGKNRDRPETPIMNFLRENPIKAKNHFDNAKTLFAVNKKKAKGDGLTEKEKRFLSDYDGQPSAKSFGVWGKGLFVRQGGSNPDQVAQQLANEGLLPDGTADALYHALEKERTGKAGLTEQQYEGEQFHRDLDERKNSTRAATSALEVGDTFNLKGESLTVLSKSRDNNEITIQGGKKYGTFKISLNTVVWIDNDSPLLKKKDAFLHFASTPDFTEDFLQVRSDADLDADASKAEQLKAKFEQRKELKERQARKLEGGADFSPDLFGAVDGVEDDQGTLFAAAPDENSTGQSPSDPVYFGDYESYPSRENQEDGSATLGDLGKAAAKILAGNTRSSREKLSSPPKDETAQEKLDVRTVFDELEALRKFFAEKEEVIDPVWWSQQWREQGKLGGEEHAVVVLDGVFYKANTREFHSTWDEYFHRLMLHNLIFPNLAYNVEGMVENVGPEGKPAIVVTQSDIEGESGEYKAKKEAAKLSSDGEYDSGDEAQRKVYVAELAKFQKKIDAYMANNLDAVKDPVEGDKYHLPGGITIHDARGENVIEAPDGELMPFDTVIKQKTRSEMRDWEWQQSQLHAATPDATGFYSGVESAIEEKMPAKANPLQVMGILNPAKSAVKKAEVEWLGIQEWLQGKKSVTKDEVLEFVRQNKLAMEEAKKGDELAFENYSAEEKAEYERLKAKGARAHVRNLTNEEVGVWNNLRRKAYPEPKYDQYTIPGGENYREVLLTLPSKLERIEKELAHKYGTGTFDIDLPANEQARLRDAEQNGSHRSSHWDEPNVAVHIRLDDRTDADGNKVLFIQEIQSDWAGDIHHKGARDEAEIKRLESQADEIERQIFSINREADSLTFKDDNGMGRVLNGMQERFDKLINKKSPLYDKKNDLKQKIQAAEGGVAPMPFANTYHELALKRVLREAVEGGYDKVAWTTGKQQIDLYSDTLRKNVDEILYKKTNNEKDFSIEFDGTVIIVPIEGKATEGSAKGKTLDDVVGKNIATKMRDNRANTPAVIKGDDLSIGGHFHKMMYDVAIPSFLKKYTKKWGVKGIEATPQRVPAQMTPDNMAAILSRHGLTNDQWFDLPQKRKDEIMTFSQPSIPVTDAMRESVQQGQALFAATPEAKEQDARYLELAKDPEKNREELQRMADEAARAAGGTKMFHGTTEITYKTPEPIEGDRDAFNQLEALAKKHGIKYAGDVVGVFERWEEFGMAEEMGLREGDIERARSLRAASEGKSFRTEEHLGFDIFNMPEGENELGVHLGSYDQASAFGEPFPMYASIKNPIRLKDLGNWNYQSVMREVRNAGVEITEEQYESVFNSYDNNAALRSLLLSKKIDGVVYKNEAKGEGDSYIAFSPTQIKSADPVTHDADGNVIPLSQRFNPKSDSILYSASPEESKPTPGDMPWDRAAKTVVKAIAGAAKSAAKSTGKAISKNDAYNALADGLARAYLWVGADKAVDPSIAFSRKAVEILRKEFVPDSLMPREAKAMFHEMKIKQSLGSEKALDVWRASEGKKVKFSDMAFPERWGKTGNKSSMRRNMFWVMNNRAPETALPKEFKEVMGKLRAMLDEQAREAVRQGRMHPDTYKSMREEGYMPHYYMQHESITGKVAAILKRYKLNQGDIRAQRLTAWRVESLTRKDRTGMPAMANWTDDKTGRKAYRFKSKQHRDAWFKDFMLAETARAVSGKSGLGKITAIDLHRVERFSPEQRAYIRFTKDAIRKKWALRKPLDEGKQEDAGLIVDPVYAVTRYVAQMSHDNATAKLFNKIADNPEWASKSDLQGLKQLPDRPSFGKLAGMYVIPELHSQITDLAELPGAAMRVYDKSLTMWKTGKTVFNPGTHARNVMGNVMFSMLAGTSVVNPANAKYYLAANKIMREGGSELLEMHEEGVLGADFVQAELRGNLLSLLPDGQLIGKDGNLSKFQEAWLSSTKKVKRASDKVHALYTYEDAIYKAAAYLRAKEKGLTPKEAADHVRAWFPFYDNVGNSTTVKFFKRGPMPFFSFFRESTRILGNGAKHRPLSLLAMMALPEIINQLSAMMLGLSDDDEEQIRKDMRGKGKLMFRDTPIFSMLMPFKDSQGRPVQWDLSNVIPFADLLGKKLDYGKKKPIWAEMADKMLASPALGVLSSMMGKDTFRDRDLYHEDETKMAKAGKTAKDIYRKLAPPILPGGTSWDTVAASTERSTNKTLERRSVPMAAARALVGLDFRNASPDWYRQQEEVRKAMGKKDGTYTPTASPPDTAERKKLWGLLVQAIDGKEDMDQIVATLDNLVDYGWDVREEKLSVILAPRNPVRGSAEEQQMNDRLMMKKGQLSFEQQMRIKREYKKVVDKAAPIINQAKARMKPPKPKLLTTTN